MERTALAVERFRPWRLDELGTVPSNGLRVGSLFSGCGGSSLGYRLAGFEVVYANEFVPLAARAYRANRSPNTVVDGRDVRQVSGVELRDRFGELDVLDGSPPCASFTAAGRGAATWGAVRSYSGTRQRVDDLFDEFVRVVGEARPRSFVAENVVGFARGVSVGFARRILAALRGLDYRVEARVLDASLLGVPQKRRRTIIVGVRDDLDRDPAFPRPSPERPVSLREAVGPYVRGQIVPVGFNGTDGERRSPNLPSFTILAELAGSNSRWPTSMIFAPPRTDPETGFDTTCRIVRVRDRFPNESVRYLCLDEVRRVCSFPDDFELFGTFPQRWERLGRAVPPLMMRAVAGALVEVLT